MGLPLMATVALCAAVGALFVGRRESLREGLAAASVGLLVALVAVLVPSVPEEVFRNDALVFALVAAACSGALLRAVLEVAATERGPWVAVVPLLGAVAVVGSTVAPALLTTGAEPRLAVFGASLGTEQQVRDLLLPVTQSVAPWVGWGWVAVALLAGLMSLNNGRIARLTGALLWPGYAVAVFLRQPALQPSRETVELLARAALHPGEKVISTAAVPAGSFAFEPGFAVALLLLAASGVASLLLAAPAQRPAPARSDVAARGLSLSLLGFAALSAARDAVGLPFGSIVGGAGLLAVSALCMTAVLFGTFATARASARLLLVVLLVAPWLLWSLLGAPL